MRVSVLAAALLLSVLGLTFAPSGGPASAAETIAQCNNVDNTPGLGLNCDVTVVNNLNVATGVANSTVTVKECHGPANTEPTCTTSTKSYDALTTSVSQCNYAANGGGASVICNVDVTNNITGAASTGVTGATVNQCNGSGAEGTAPTLNCDPFPANVSGATITQCNGSVNGGGASDRVTCTVTPSTMSAQLPVSINQCNNTANGGGSVVTCAASLKNISLASSTTPTPKASPVAKNKLHDSKTDGFTHVSAGGNDSPVFLGAGALLLAGLLTAAFAARRIGARR
ncbi:hypothetical protein E3T37_14740 [Cryobacterium sp. TMT2-10]|nr:MULTISPECIES: hypothetical protein [unclassified Cryobacterium]TFC88445.1 hypothetical protein E3T24_02960 [Cryobacterium sp. TmT2-59]TFD18920.1 hypothetical protein E3T32_11050 [Cryobacterium sp. TMT2-23]TFD35773.1 hypothetical protein E3T37_14740 [Cryobacterium sp. TMT2-10]